MTANNQLQSGDFFSFRKFVSSDLIKVIYALGMVGITIWALITIVTALGMPSAFGRTPTLLWGIGILIFGNLLWRIFCEFLILSFSIHDSLESIRKQFDREGLSDISESIREPLEQTTAEFRKGVAKLESIEKEIREGVTYSDLRDSFSSIAEQLENSSNRLATIEGEIQEGISYGDLRETLTSIAQEFKEGSARLTVIEENMREGVGSAELRSDFTTIVDRLGDIESELQEAVQHLQEGPTSQPANAMGTGAPAVSGSQSDTGYKKPSKRKGVAIGMSIAAVLLVGVFFGLPIAAGYGQLDGLAPQDINSFVTSVVSYWTQLVAGTGS
ncbi:MAG: DUF4282 domain-containing protein [Salinibacter sp.]